MFKVKLKKIKSSHQNLRTDEIVGFTEFEKPVVGDFFFMTAEALTEPFKSMPGGARMIHTTKIQEVREESENIYQFETRNSVYTVEYLKEETNDAAN